MSRIAAWPPAVRAVVWMVGALASFTAMGVAGRELAHTMGAFEISFFRAIGGLVIVAALIWRTGLAGARVRRWHLHLVRNVFHFMGQTLWFFGLSLLPLATVFALEFTMPIWTVILAVIFLRERMNPGRLVAVALGFVGVLVIVRPGAEVFDPASLIVVLAAFGFAVSNVCTKPLSRDNTPFAIILMMNLIQAPLGLFAASFDWVWPGPDDLPWLLVVGTAGLTAHFCITRAFMLADASLILPIDYLRLPLAAGLGYLLYDESVELALLIGAVIIFVGNSYSIRYEARLHKSNKETKKGGA